MRVMRMTLACCVLFGAAATAGNAEAAREWHGAGQAAEPARHAAAPKALIRKGITQVGGRHGLHASGQRAPRHSLTAAGSAGGISCVPYARSVTGMAIYGNGGDWWGNAAGSYDRGQRPEPGSIMAFRATGGMTRGHVAVVSRVLGSREVLIDHANWGGPGIRRGSVMHNISVMDVSENNDWTAVRVQSGYNPNSFGRIYPIFGFIYNRPEDGAVTTYAAAAPRRSLRLEQVAEVPTAAQPAASQVQGQAALRKAAAHRRD